MSLAFFAPSNLDMHLHSDLVLLMEAWDSGKVRLPHRPVQACAHLCLALILIIVPFSMRRESVQMVKRKTE